MTLVIEKSFWLKRINDHDQKKQYEFPNETQLA